MSFGFMNGVVNPVMRPLLRSPLHGLASGRVMLIGYTGRKTGKLHTVPVQYARDDEGIVVAVGWPEKKVWWRNLVGGGEVELRVHGEQLAGHAEALRGSEDPDRVAAALDRYHAQLPKSKPASQIADAVVVVISLR
jgi:deazaflavin-dependent oxidoreductase (nitroreductase family)